MLNKLLKRLITTTTQEDIKLLDELLIKRLRNKTDINDPRLHEKFKEGLKKKIECCNKCDEVKNIVKPKVTFKMEQDTEIKNI